MSVLLDNVYHLNTSSDITYSLVLNSNDRIAGTHNNPTFNIEWDNFLPLDNTEYKVCYTFQSTSGYYCDAFYQKNPLAPTTGVGNATTNGTNPTVGSTQLQFTSSTNLAVNNYIYGTGIPIGTYITYINAVSGIYYVGISNPLTGTVPGFTLLQTVIPTTLNPVGFSSARVMADFGSKSFSYDTSVKGSSLNLGVISRDVQTLSSKSNTFSAFYCQNNPRTIVRPINNQFTISIMNNSVFQGGVVSYNAAGSVVSYGSTASSLNYLCDTKNMAPGSVPIAGGMLTDMSPWTMILEFIPINKKPKY